MVKRIKSNKRLHESTRTKRHIRNKWYVKESRKRNFRENRKRLFKEDLDIRVFGELTPEQQDYVIDNFDKTGYGDMIWEDFCEVVMEEYHENLKELTKRFTAKTGIEVDTEKLYWDSNSHGYYTEYRLEDVLAAVYVELPTVYGYKIGIDIVFEGSDIGFGRTRRNGNNDIIMTIPEYDETGYDSSFYGAEDVEFYYDNFESTNDILTADGIKQLKQIMKDVENYLNDVDNLIRDCYEAYPNEEWIRNMLDANDYEFAVDEDTEDVYSARYY